MERSKETGLEDLDGLAEVGLLLVALIGGCRTAVLEEIVGEGWSLECVDDYESCPFFYAAARGQKLLTRSMMDEADGPEAALAELSADEAGAMPLHYAALNGHNDVAALFLARGADPDPVDNSGATPLHYAARRHHTDVVEILVQPGANINAVKKNGNTPLHEALRGYDSAAEILLRRSVTAIDDTLRPTGPAVNVVMERQDEGPEDTALLLIQNGAGINSRNNDGKSPLDLAEAAGLKKVVEILKKKS